MAYFIIFIFLFSISLIVLTTTFRVCGVIYRYKREEKRDNKNNDKENDGKEEKEE